MQARHCELQSMLFLGGLLGKVAQGKSPGGWDTTARGSITKLEGEMHFPTLGIRCGLLMARRETFSLGRAMGHRLLGLLSFCKQECKFFCELERQQQEHAANP